MASTVIILGSDDPGSDALGRAQHVIEPGLANELEDAVDFNYRPDGLICTMTLCAPTDALDG